MKRNGNAGPGKSENADLIINHPLKPNSELYTFNKEKHGKYKDMLIENSLKTKSLIKTYIERQEKFAIMHLDTEEFGEIEVIVDLCLATYLERIEWKVCKGRNGIYNIYSEHGTLDHVIFKRKFSKSNKLEVGNKLIYVDGNQLNKRFENLDQVKKDGTEIKSSRMPTKKERSPETMVRDAKVKKPLCKVTKTPFVEKQPKRPRPVDETENLETVALMSLREEVEEEKPLGLVELTLFEESVSEYTTRKLEERKKQ